ncbi:CbiX [Pandoraea terrae]|uniref:CbiX n=1 Tax=Pandoraea terrae TaxID=1537710 RepID=A0A5E4RI33_9BURK|nr:CbiX/SirB N-terminal domain-containing protein [Pandoraea terrae]VVD62214.1 CbiX [Pandoraea terrae]
MGTPGLILFGHGARDARWAEPFERLRERVAQQRPDAHVRLAFLDLMTPNLPDAVAELASAGCTDVTIIPVFFGQGGHVRRDLPAIVAQCQAAHPGVAIRSATAVGEDDDVLDALAAYCLRMLGRA